MRVTAVLLAAGAGRRMGEEKNKVYLPIRGKPLVAYTIRPFLRSERIDEIVIVVRPGEEDEARSVLSSETPPARIVPGGEERRDSALAGVEAASGEIVLIHDGARPFVSGDLIDRVIDGAIAHGACIPILPSIDTLRFLNDDRTVSSARLDRSKVVRVQTPQGFRTELIRGALAESRPEIPDDAEALLAMGVPVFTVPGEETNLKVTRPTDLDIAEAIASLLELSR